MFKLPLATKGCSTPFRNKSCGNIFMFKFTKLIKHFKNNSPFNANIKLFYINYDLRLQKFYSEWRKCNNLNISIIVLVWTLVSGSIYAGWERQKLIQNLVRKPLGEMVCKDRRCTKLGHVRVQWQTLASTALKRLFLIPQCWFVIKF
jgi:hypothetical protein